MEKNGTYLFLFLILWISQNVFCKYQKCLATTNYYTQDFDGDEFKVFSQFSIQNNKGGPNTVTVSNITVDLENAPHFENVCIVPENQEQICFNDFPKTVKFSLENSTFQMLVDFGTKDTLGYFPAFGIIDQGSIVFENGGLFSQEQPCQTLYIPEILLNRTSCCTSFVPPAAPSLPSTAPCKKFKSISSVRNVNENFRISASSQAFFSYTNTNLYANLSYTQQNNGGVDLAVNAGSLHYQAFNSTTTNATFWGNNFWGHGDYEYLLRMTFYNMTTETATPSFFVGRIIFQGNQTFMEEGIPFTSKNNCYYSNEQLSSNQVVSTSLCCIEFKN